MTNEEKASEIIGGGCNRQSCSECGGSLSVVEGCVEFRHLKEMAEWKDEQMMELCNVARNIYAAWMGGTMNDVRECMKDLGHVYDEFKDGIQKSNETRRTRT